MKGVFYRVASEVIQGDPSTGGSAHYKVNNSDAPLLPPTLPLCLARPAAITVHHSVQPRHPINRTVRVHLLVQKGTHKITGQNGDIAEIPRKAGLGIICRTIFAFSDTWTNTPAARPIVCRLFHEPHNRLQPRAQAATRAFRQNRSTGSAGDVRRHRELSTTFVLYEESEGDIWSFKRRCVRAWARYIRTCRCMCTVHIP